MEVLIPKILNNKEGLYNGNLHYYFNVVFDSPNSCKPYHNFRHMMSVTCEAYKAIKAHRKALNKDDRRTLLIAALLHDYGHSGRGGEEETNIAVAIRSAEELALEEDQFLLPSVKKLIQSTHFPYIDDAQSLSEKIIRDADIVQIFSNVWIRQVVFGLAKENGKTKREMLAEQLPFLSKLSFQTEWFEKKYFKWRIRKIEEVKQYLEILEE